MANQYENESNEGIEIKTEFTDENDPLKASSFEQSIMFLRVWTVIVSFLGAIFILRKGKGVDRWYS